MLKIINRILQKEMKYENTVVLKYHIEYSEIVMDWQQNRNGIKKFNDYNLKMALQTQQKAENELYKEATELYKEPYMIEKDNSWVAKVMNAVKHTPFSRVKTTFGRMNEETARAKG